MPNIPSANSPIDFIKRNRKLILVLAVALFIFFLLMTLASLLGQNKDPAPPPGSVDQQFNFDNSSEITIPREVEFPETDNNVNGYYVFDIEKIDHSDLVQNFLVKIGKATWTREQYEDIYYIWQIKGSDPQYLVDYDSILDQVFFRFEAPVSADLIHSGGILTAPEVEAYFNQFAKEYLGLNVAFGNFKVSRVNNEYRIEANRQIEEINVLNTGFLTYSDYLHITEDGDVIEGKFNLFELGGRYRVELIDPDILGSVINREDYPKDVSEQPPIGLDLLKPDTVPHVFGDGFLGDAYDEQDLIEYPSPKSCTVKKAELVYYYIRTTAKSLAPTYRLECEGLITYEGEEYVVPSIIYTNAVDPELVFVPGQRFQ